MQYPIKDVRRDFLKLLVKKFEQDTCELLSEDSLEFSFYHNNIRFQVRIYTRQVYLIGFPSENIIFNKIYNLDDGGFHSSNVIQTVEYIERFTQLVKRICQSHNTEIIHLQACLLDEN